MNEPTVTLTIPNLEGILPGDGKNDLKEKILKLLAARYRAFIQRRFVTFSRGGGDWVPLKPSTIKARRKGIKPSKKSKEQQEIAGFFGSPAILVDTAILKNAMQAQLGINAVETFDTETDSASVTIAYSDNFHPPETRKGKDGKPLKPALPIRISELAAIHHFGTEHIPARPILVAPDERTMGIMDNIILTEMQKNL